MRSFLEGVGAADDPVAQRAGARLATPAAGSRSSTLAATPAAASRSRFRSSILAAAGSVAAGAAGLVAAPTSVSGTNWSGARTGSPGSRAHGSSPSEGNAGLCGHF